MAAPERLKNSLLRRSGHGWNIAQTFKRTYPPRCKEKGANYGKTDIKQNSRSGRAGVLFQRNDDRGAAIPRREIPASSIQQQRVVRAFRHWTHGHVADQERSRLALFAWEMHVTAARRMACQASRIQATMIEPEGSICQKGFAKALRSPVCLRRP